MIDDPPEGVGSQGTMGSQGTAGGGGGGIRRTNGTRYGGNDAQGFIRITYTIPKRVFITHQ